MVILCLVLGINYMKPRRTPLVLFAADVTLVLFKKPLSRGPSFVSRLPVMDSHADRGCSPSQSHEPMILFYPDPSEMPVSETMPNIEAK